MAFAGGALNLSLALGAFAAGLVVSESIYSHRILSDILPFKDLFLAIFFISVGLLIDLSVIAADWQRVLLGSRGDSGSEEWDHFHACSNGSDLPGRPAMLATASLASTGEFSLVLIGKAGGYRPFDPSIEQMLLVCTAVTMAVVPSLMRGADAAWEMAGEEGDSSAPARSLPETMTPIKAIKEISRPRDHLRLRSGRASRSTRR